MKGEGKEQGFRAVTSGAAESPFLPQNVSFVNVKKQSESSSPLCKKNR